MGMKFNQNASKQRHFVEPKLAACEFTQLLLQIERVISWSGVTLPDENVATFGFWRKVCHQNLCYLVSLCTEDLDKMSDTPYARHHKPLSI